MFNKSFLPYMMKIVLFLFYNLEDRFIRYFENGKQDLLCIAKLETLFLCSASYVDVTRHNIPWQQISRVLLPL